MKLAIEDSLSRFLNSLDLNHPINIYVCGPTVYDLCHVGHSRVFMVFDLLVRVLRKFTDVVLVQNLTDIAEQITTKAKTKNKNPREIADFYINEFKKDRKLLNILSPSHEPRPSLYIPQIIEYIQLLISKNKAKITQEGVVFLTNSIENYGVFNKSKAHHDFTLWKITDQGEFDSPWGKGNPGWHIECSVMSEYFFGKHFHIHGGGKDLRFPHHENEIAQHKGKHKNSNSPCDLWMHVGLININGEKMSKSLGNFWFIRDVVKTSIDADALRYLFLSYKYNTDIEISEEILDKARTTIFNIRQFYFANKSEITEFDGDTFLYQLFNAKSFNTNIIIDEINKSIKEKNINKLAYLLETSGFKMENLCSLATEEIQFQLKERQKQKNLNNFQEADKIREFLFKNYVLIKDSKSGSEFYYR